MVAESIRFCISATKIVSFNEPLKRGTKCIIKIYTNTGFRSPRFKFKEMLYRTLFF